jgi:carbon monoxide dehydrogenase subunit G
MAEYVKRTQTTISGIVRKRDTMIVTRPGSIGLSGTLIMTGFFSLVSSVGEGRISLRIGKQVRIVKRDMGSHA